MNGDAASPDAQTHRDECEHKPSTETYSKENVSIFTKNHVLYSCHKIDEDFPCVSWNCALEHSPLPTSPGGTPEHGPLSDPTNEIPVINSIN